MKVHLMFRDHDFDPTGPIPEEASELIQDLGLTPLLDAMSGGDRLLSEVTRAALLTGLADPEAIQYRQQVLNDCLDHPELARELYEIAVEALAAQRRVFTFGRQAPSGILRYALRVMRILLGPLRRVRELADQAPDTLRSEGILNMFRTVREEIDDGYFQDVEECLAGLEFRDGITVGAGLGQGNAGDNYYLSQPPQVSTGFLERIGLGRRDPAAFDVAPRDEAGARALAELADRGINSAASALAQAADHVVAYFGALAAEVGFYIGCLNLADNLASRGLPFCIPKPAANLALSAQGLYGPSLALVTQQSVVENSLAADGRALIVITGANSGGKSTFLRSLGTAQLMMQSGMFVTATAFEAAVGSRVFTHFARDEDPTMANGRLAEELARMSRLAGAIDGRALVLLNESFESTNEAEGSEIARQVIRALLEAGCRVVLVTHLYDLADSLYQRGNPGTLFLRADPATHGGPTYVLTEGPPRPTAFGPELFRKMGGWELPISVAGASTPGNANPPDRGPI